MEARVGVPFKQLASKTRPTRADKKKKKRARQWQDQLELFTGFQHHVNFPFERWELKGLTSAVRFATRWNPRASQMGSHVKS